jgi:hypothetical protein
MERHSHEFVLFNWMWHNNGVQTFLERFVLTILAALFLAVITNPMHLELWPRVGAGLVIIIFAYFCARAAHKHGTAGQRKVADGSQVPNDLATKLPVAVGSSKVVIAAENVKDLRERHGVERLRETQSGKTFAEIPPSSFCFMYGNALVRGYERGAVAVSDDSNLRFEVHKLASGVARVVAYAGPETRDRLLEGLRKGETLTIYASSCEAAADVVVVPVDHLKFNRERTLTIAKKQLSALDCEAL